MPLRSVRELVRVYGIEDLPTIADLDPYRLGSTSSVFGRAGEYGLRDTYLARTARHVDARLAEAVVGGRLVLVVGPSKAGKTRTVFEAVRAHDPGARVVWPVTEGLGELAANPRISTSTDPLVVWLDDLHEYLTGTSGLTPAVLARLTARPGSTAVVATLRSEMRAQLRGGGELRQDTRMLFEQAITIDLASTSDDPAEQAAAARAYPGHTSDGQGLGESLAGAPELLARYDDARAADPTMHTVIAVAIDWARIGRTDPIPEPLLLDLALRRLRRDHPHLDPTMTGVRAAAVTARTPPPGAGRTAALRTTYRDDEVRDYRAFDYLVAADDGQDHRTPRPIPESYWHDATRDCDHETLLKVGDTAYLRADKRIALTILREAAARENTDAMRKLGFLLIERGDDAEGEAWYRKAADAGSARAMFNLGFQLIERGDDAEGETWYRKAADIGHGVAMFNLAVRLLEKGELAEGESWYRKAAETGYPRAMFNFGARLLEQGQVVEGETWYRRAADAGYTRAMFNLGFLLVTRGKEAEGEAWYRTAADAGSARAMFNLGALLIARGEVAEGEAWYRRAADAEDTAVPEPPMP